VYVAKENLRLYLNRNPQASDLTINNAAVVMLAAIDSLAVQENQTHGQSDAQGFPDPRREYLHATARRSALHKTRDEVIWPSPLSGRAGPQLMTKQARPRLLGWNSLLRGGAVISSALQRPTTASCAVLFSLGLAFAPLDRGRR
jgi:hypothetical protein